MRFAHVLRLTWHCHRNVFLLLLFVLSKHVSAKKAFAQKYSKPLTIRYSMFFSLLISCERQWCTVWLPSPFCVVHFVLTIFSTWNIIQEFGLAIHLCFVTSPCQDLAPGTIEQLCIENTVSHGVDSTGADAFCIGVSCMSGCLTNSCYDFNAGVAFGAFVCAVSPTTYTAMLRIHSEAK